MLILAIVAGLLPGFAWLAFYLSEATHPEPKRLIVFTFLVGMAYGFFAVALEEIFNNGMAKIGVAELSIISLVGLAAIEEIIKFAAAHFAIAKSPRFSAPVDAMIYMIVAALGFATLENIGALAGVTPQIGYGYLPMAMEMISLRFVGATLLHSLTAGIVGYYWALGIARLSVPRYLLPGIVLATATHVAFNYLVITYGDAVYSVLFLLIVGFFVLNDFEKLKVKPV